MFTMRDGRLYNSDYCFNHQSYENKFKGVKYKLKIIFKTKFKKITKEFKEYMRPYLLKKERIFAYNQIFIKKGVYKTEKIDLGNYLLCPKCRVTIALK